MISNGPVETSQENEPRYTVGTELRMAREERGLRIREVVDAVRIQARYLEALEDGRIADLPGTVYALGFVRTYAEYLGLDGAQMVSRFKDEAKGLQVQEYVLPEPIDEGKVPTAAIIIVAILLTGVAYGAWHFLYRADSQLTEQVPDVPEHLAALVPPEETATAEVAPRTDQPENAAVDAEPTATQPEIPPSREETSPTGPEAAPSTAVQAPAPANPASQASPVSEAVPAPAETAETGNAGPAEPSAAPSESAVAQTEQTTLPTERVAALESPAPPTPPAEPVAREPRVFGADNPDARIVINADEDAWVEVTDSDGALLFSRVLRKGDSFRVPDRPGAVFVTGNAGGLAIKVDGDAVPPIGPAGVVRRNVRLDPDQLKAGTAWP